MPYNLKSLWMFVLLTSAERNSVLEDNFIYFSQYW